MKRDNKRRPAARHRRTGETPKPNNPVMAGTAIHDFLTFHAHFA